MNRTYIEQVIKDIAEVLASPDSKLTAADIEKLTKSKARLIESIEIPPERGLTDQEKSAIIQALLILMEVLKYAAEHFK